MDDYMKIIDEHIEYLKTISGQMFLAHINRINKKKYKDKGERLVTRYNKEDI